MKKKIPRLRKHRHVLHKIRLRARKYFFLGVSALANTFFSGGGSRAFTGSATLAVRSFVVARAIVSRSFLGLRPASGRIPGRAFWVCTPQRILWSISHSARRPPGSCAASQALRLSLPPLLKCMHRLRFARQRRLCHVSAFARPSYRVRTASQACPPPIVKFVECLRLRRAREVWAD